MYYSQTKIIISGLAHVPILIFILNLIKGKFKAIAVNALEVKVEEPKVKVIKVKEQKVKAEELKPSEVKEEAE